MGLRVTYNIRYGHYIFNIKYVRVQYEMGLPYIDAKKQDVDFIKPSREILKGSPIKISPRPNLIANLRE